MRPATRIADGYVEICGSSVELEELTSARQLVDRVGPDVAREQLAASYTGGWEPYPAKLVGWAAEWDGTVLTRDSDRVELVCEVRQPAESLPARTIVAAKDWVAIKMEFPRLPNFPWEVAGSGVPNATNENIDLLIGRGHASVLRIGDGTEPPETVDPEHGILATISTGILTAESTVTVNGVTYPIPEQTRWVRPGSKVGIHRLLEALQGAGYQPVGGDYRASLVPGGIRVEKLGE